MAKTRVVLNTAEFGRQVTGSPDMGAYIGAIAGRVAAAVNGTVEVVTSPAAGGGSRVHAHISNGTNDREEAASNQLVSALTGIGS